MKMLMNVLRTRTTVNIIAIIMLDPIPARVCQVTDSTVMDVSVMVSK